MPVPVLSVAQMRDWENASWATGQTEAAVIERVGALLGRRALQLTRAGDFILILAGRGHNGDDARGAAKHLAARRVEVLEVTEPGAVMERLEALLNARPLLIIDGLFGIGLNRPMDAAWVQLIQRINAARRRVFAVDVPSGLDADTGDTHGAAIQAAITWTLGAPKTGLLNSSAWPFVGRLEVETDIGLIPCPHTTELDCILAEDFADYPPSRVVASHKGTYGHLVIIAGSVGYHGAAVLAARGAQRARPGLISVFTPESAYHVVASQLQSSMVHVLTPDVKLPTDFTAILIGPGLAGSDVPEAATLLTRKLWRDTRVPVIVDASALNWLPLDSGPRNAVRLLTPHPGEAARLLTAPVPQVQANRFTALRDVSRRFGNCWVTIKGHQTLVGRNTGNLSLNVSGNPHLAQGGSGDLLAGYVSGLLAQPALQDDAGMAIRYAIWQHGAAADYLESRRSNWIVEDLAERLGEVPPESR